MAFQSVPSTAEIVVNYVGQAKPIVNVLAAEKFGGYTLADITSLAAAVDVAIAANFLPIQTDEVLYVQTTVRGLEFPNDLEATNGASTAVGGQVTPGASGNVTLSIKKGSGFTGRSARGRLYWIGLTALNLQSNKNLVDLSAADAIEVAVELVRLAILTAGWTPVIVSRFSDGVERPFGITFDWITSVAVDLEVDSQRSRLAS